MFWVCQSIGKGEPGGMESQFPLFINLARLNVLGEIFQIFKFLVIWKMRSFKRSFRIFSYIQTLDCFYLKGLKKSIQGAFWKDP